MLSPAVGEFMGTMVLVLLGNGCILSRPNLPAGLGPFLVAALVWGLILALAGTTGSSMNPARDLSSGIAHAILPIPGKGSSDWGYAPISVLGTLAGGVLGGLAFASTRADEARRGEYSLPARRRIFCGL
jgi:glycerol uptake facilitator protein